MPQHRDFKVGDQVYVAHRLGQAVLTGTVTRTWTQRIIWRGRITDVPRASVLFPDGAHEHYPQSWLQPVFNDRLSTLCPRCEEANLVFAISVSMPTPTGSSQIGTFRCPECDYVLSPDVSLTVRIYHDEPGEPPIRGMDGAGT